MEKSSRTKTALVTLAIGLALNIALGAAKLVTGVLADSTAVTSDALNNLSDAAVSVVTIIATALAARAADHEHPFGHGRYEYIATFILGAVIVAVGAEVFSSGLKRAITPVEVDMNVAVWATLAAAIAVKSGMAVFYRVYGKRIGSDAIKAAAVDSVSDAGVTSAVLICAVVEKFTGAHIDGYASMAVAAVIIVFAVRILKSTVSRLLGERPDPKLHAEVKDIITSDPRVLSVHDLIINDYGAAKRLPRRMRCSPRTWRSPTCTPCATRSNAVLRNKRACGCVFTPTRLFWRTNGLCCCASALTAQFPLTARLRTTWLSTTKPKK